MDIISRRVCYVRVYKATDSVPVSEERPKTEDGLRRKKLLEGLRNKEDKEESSLTGLGLRTWDVGDVFNCFCLL